MKESKRLGVDVKDIISLRADFESMVDISQKLAKIMVEQIDYRDLERGAKVQDLQKFLDRREIGVNVFLMFGPTVSHLYLSEQRKFLRKFGINWKEEDEDPMR